MCSTAFAPGGASSSLGFGGLAAERSLFSTAFTAGGPSSFSELGESGSWHDEDAGGRKRGHGQFNEADKSSGLGDGDDWLNDSPWERASSIKDRLASPRVSFSGRSTGGRSTGRYTQDQLSHVTYKRLSNMIRPPGMPQTADSLPPIFAADISDASDTQSESENLEEVMVGRGMPKQIIYHKEPFLQHNMDAPPQVGMWALDYSSQISTEFVPGARRDKPKSVEPLTPKEVLARKRGLPPLRKQNRAKSSSPPPVDRLGRRCEMPAMRPGDDASGSASKNVGYSQLVTKWQTEHDLPIADLAEDYGRQSMTFDDDESSDTEAVDVRSAFDVDLVKPPSTTPPKAKQFVRSRVVTADRINA